MRNCEPNRAPFPLCISAAIPLVCLIALSGCDQATPTPPPDPAGAGAHFGLSGTAPSHQQEEDRSYGDSDDDPYGDLSAMDEQSAVASHAGDGGEARPVSFVGLRATMPAEWTQQQPQSPMHAASFTVPHAEGDGEPAEIVVFFFGQGQGGPIDANIQRWVDQFRTPEGGPVEAQVQRFDVAGMPVTLVELEGEYRGVGDRWYTPDRGFITATVDAPGERRIFIRLLGEKATVDSNREAFLAMVRAIQPD